ncbi:60S ribosomal protein L17 [Hondaea fermentalgiana]|uniref:60S ribosomal protein L17 n=1 Tax=Hondaea fermentalgiana TaxID=2315210 RepID=A0A2R5GHD6_9STRA|nr:60S ribosomal protein L17 [Hondaea fermentalgiana]|eukprot:GBG27691.1 60S ribosomal protein L17 [Hondaea fermentalgiana]
MGRSSTYSVDDDKFDPSTSCKARASQLRTHFKKMINVGRFIRGMKIDNAIAYLEQVLEKERAIPFKQHRAGCGRHAQAKIISAPGDQVGWPVKSVKFMLDLLANLRANAESKDLDIDNLYIRHVQVNQAIKMRRRTFRAHGRIGPYMRNPCHVELVAAVKGEPVEKEKRPEPLLTRKRMAQLRRAKVPIGGGVDE